MGQGLLRGQGGRGQERGAEMWILLLMLLLQCFGTKKAPAKNRGASFCTSSPLGGNGASDET